MKDKDPGKVYDRYRKYKGYHPANVKVGIVEAAALSTYCQKRGINQGRILSRLIRELLLEEGINLDEIFGCKLGQLPPVPPSREDFVQGVRTLQDATLATTEAA